MSSKVFKTKKLHEVALNPHQFPDVEQFSHLITLGSLAAATDRENEGGPGRKRKSPPVMVTIAEEDIDDREKNAYEAGVSETEMRMQQVLDAQEKMVQQKIDQMEKLDAQRISQLEQRSAQQIGALEQRLSQEQNRCRQLEQQGAQAIQKAIAELVRYQKRLAEESERQIAKLSLEIARKVVHREVRVDVSILMAMIKVALEYVADSRKARIRLHPEDLNLIRKAPDQDLPVRGGLPMEMVEDPLMERGGFLVESDMGIIDGRLNRQFQEIERNFFGVQS